MVGLFEIINKDNISRGWVISASWWWNTSGMGAARARGSGLLDLLTRVLRGRWREDVVTRMSKYLLVIQICKIIYYQVLSKQHLIDGTICDIKIPDDKKRVSHFSPIRYLVGLLTKDNFNIWQACTQKRKLSKNKIKTRGWARYCCFTGILDSWCFMGIFWMHTFFWNNYGIAEPFDHISPILFWSWGESHCEEKPISERTLFRNIESCFRALSFSIDICEKVKPYLKLVKKLTQETVNFIK